MAVLSLFFYCLFPATHAATQCVSVITLYGGAGRYLDPSRAIDLREHILPQTSGFSSKNIFLTTHD